MPRGRGEGRQPSPPARLPPCLLLPWGHGVGQKVACKNGAMMSSPIHGVRAPSAQHEWHGASSCSQAPPAASSSLVCKGLHPPSPSWPGALLGWAGESSFFLLSGQPVAGTVPREQWKQNFSAARSQGSAPALVSFRNRSCSCHCLVCGLVPAHIMSQGTGLAVFPAQPLRGTPRPAAQSLPGGVNTHWGVVGCFEAGGCSCPGRHCHLGAAAAMNRHTDALSVSSSPGSGYYTAESHANEVYVEEAPPDPALDYRRGNGT